MQEEQDRPETYEEKVKRAMSRDWNRFGNKEAGINETLADESGIVEGCYRVKPAHSE